MMLDLVLAGLVWKSDVDEAAVGDDVSVVMRARVLVGSFPILYQADLWLDPRLQVSLSPHRLFGERASERVEQRGPRIHSLFF